MRPCQVEAMQNAFRIEPDGRAVFAFGFLISLLLWCSPATSQQASGQPELNDVHFHLTNYIQEGTDIHEFLKIMGSKVGRVALFGIPLQQQWSYQNSGYLGPTY